MQCEQLGRELSRQRERLEKELAGQQQKLSEAREEARSEARKEKDALAQTVSRWSPGHPLTPAALSQARHSVQPQTPRVWRRLSCRWRVCPSVWLSCRVSWIRGAERGPR